MGRGLLGALAGAMAGAAAWAAVAFFLGLEAGMLAVAVGALAGLGMAWGTDRRGRMGAGVLAAVVAMLGIFVGKFMGAHFTAQAWAQEHASYLSGDPAQLGLCVSVMAELSERGVEFSCPTGYSLFPPEVLREVERRWAVMSPSERMEYSTKEAAAIQSGLATMTSVMAFFGSFGVFDLLWFPLAMVGAYKFGSPASASDEQEEASDVSARRSAAREETPRAAPTRLGTPEAGAAVGPLAGHDGAPKKFVPRTIKVAGYTSDGPVEDQPAGASNGEHESGGEGAARRAA